MTDTTTPTCVEPLKYLVITVALPLGSTTTSPVRSWVWSSTMSPDAGGMNSWKSVIGPQVSSTRRPCFAASAKTWRACSARSAAARSSFATRCSAIACVSASQKPAERELGEAHGLGHLLDDGELLGRLLRHGRRRAGDAGHREDEEEQPHASQEAVHGGHRRRPPLALDC